MIVRRGYSANAWDIGIAERIPYLRASYDGEVTTERPDFPPTTAGKPRSSGRSSSSTDKKKASMSICKMVESHELSAHSGRRLELRPVETMCQYHVICAVRLKSQDFSRSLPLGRRFGTVTTTDAMWFNNTLYSRMQDLLADYQQRARSIAESAEPLVTSITDLVQGGKRLRALLAWWGWQGAGGDADDPRIIDAGVALELFQAAALIHDDILDRSNTRRGQPSVHKRFQNLHDDNQWVQDGTHFGVSAGILAGDLALGLSEEIFSTTADATAFAVPA